MSTQLLELKLPHLRMSALTWGSERDRLAICLHGFPDSAWSWREFGPELAAGGYYVVAPFTRGYAPSELPEDRDYHVGALMFDTLAIHSHFGSPGNAVLIGHDWGAFTTNALAAYPDSPFATHITMSVPPIGAMKPFRHRLDKEITLGLRQLRMSWYILFFQLPFLPQRVVHRVIPKLWRDWSWPGWDTEADIMNTLSAMPTRAHREAAIGYYRALVRPGRPAPRYARLHRYAFEIPPVPMLHLQGRADGAVQLEYTQTVERAPGSRTHVVDTGHFMHVEQPKETAQMVLDFLADV